MQHDAYTNYITYNTIQNSIHTRTTPCFTQGSIVCALQYLTQNTANFKQKKYCNLKQHNSKYIYSHLCTDNTIKHTQQYSNHHYRQDRASQLNDIQRTTCYALHNLNTIIQYSTSDTISNLLNIQ